MSQLNQALKVALAAVEQLPVKLQRQLAEQVLVRTADEYLAVVYLKRLSSADQARLQELMDKNNEGLLTRAERLELRRLGAKVDKIMLENSKSLARATRPELFDEKGKPIKSRIRAALKSDSLKQNGAKTRMSRR
jgi:hypothetical protein